MLGKSGDILSILPILYAEWKETGRHPSLIVSKDYSALPRCLDWLDVEEYAGSFDYLGDALKWAKKKGKVDFIPQQHSVGSYPIPSRKHPSFQYDQWDRCGRLHQWGKLPLILPRTGNAQKPDEGPYILYADHSQSSPFDHREDLFLELEKTFPSHSIVRCSSMRLPLLLDFLSLMDGAELIVTIDTSFLHLSAATDTPVICLVTDKPGLWWGSAHHPRMSLHVRYSDYQSRKREIISTAKRIIY